VGVIPKISKNQEVAVLHIILANATQLRFVFGVCPRTIICEIRGRREFERIPFELKMSRHSRANNPHRLLQSLTPRDVQQMPQLPFFGQNLIKYVFESLSLLQPILYTEASAAVVNCEQQPSRR
jgi:hypothetical protein